MFNNTQKIIFLITLMSGTMITISSSSWLSAWMGLEINLLSFIPLINNSDNLMSSETALKYFLTQAIASSIFLVSVIISSMKMNMPQMSCWYQLLTMTALMMKAGIAPFHFWFPAIMEGLSWMNSLILLTWQKIAPMILLSYIFNFNYMISMIIISALIGALGGLNQTSLRKLMAFSSINHLAWMMMSMQESIKLFLTYFAFYTFLSASIIMMFYLMKAFYINQLFSMMSNSPILKFTVYMNLLSLGGLPPFIGFVPKWMIIQQMMLMNQMIIIVILIISSLITLFFYLRMCYSAFLMGNMTHNWNNLYMQNMQIKIMCLIPTFVSIMGLPLISIYFF